MVVCVSGRGMKAWDMRYLLQTIPAAGLGAHAVV